MVQFAVVQERFEKIDAECLAEILREHGGLTRTDAARVARREQGILWERFERDEAQRVVAALSAQDYATRAVPADSLPQLQKPRTVRWLEIGDDTVGVPWGIHQETISVPWPCVFVISAGDVGEVVEKIVPKSARYDPYRGRTVKEEEVQRETRSVPVTDVIAVAEDGKYVHFRLASNDLAFDRILESPPTTTSYQKYVDVVGELIARSTSAVVSPQTRRLVVERKEKYSAPRSADWAGIDQLAFEKYNRWLLQLVVFNEGRK